MVNLVDYITSKIHIPICKKLTGEYVIYEVDWCDAIYDITGITTELQQQPGYGYLYQMTAGKLIKEIYKSTHAQQLQMILANGDIQTYQWYEDCQAYYNTNTQILLGL